VSGGGDSSTALKADGTLWTWGQNNYGQLGLGNTTLYSSPKQVGAANTWAKLFTNPNAPRVLAIRS
jgi:hypothetical protein